MTRNQNRSLMISLAGWCLVLASTELLPSGNVFRTIGTAVSLVLFALSLYVLFRPDADEPK